MANRPVPTLSGRFRLSPERISTPNGADLELLNTTSPLTIMLRVVVSQPRLSCLLAFIQRHPFPGQLPQPGQVTAPDASLEFTRNREAVASSSSSLSRSRQLKALLEKPLMVHLLKTARSKLPRWRTKSKHYFSPYVRPTALLGRVPQGVPRRSSLKKIVAKNRPLERRSSHIRCTRCPLPLHK